MFDTLEDKPFPSRNCLSITKVILVILQIPDPKNVFLYSREIGKDWGMGQYFKLAWRSDGKVTFFGATYFLVILVPLNTSLDLAQRICIPLDVFFHTTPRYPC